MASRAPKLRGRRGATKEAKIQEWYKAVLEGGR